MSKGHPRITLRVDQEDLEEIGLFLGSHNARTREAPWSVSDFIRAAIAEKIAHLIRSRRKKIPVFADCDECGNTIKTSDEAFCPNIAESPQRWICNKCVSQPF